MKFRQSKKIVSRFNRKFINRSGNNNYEKLRLLFIITLTIITGISLTGLPQNKKDHKQHEKKIYINKKGEIHDHGNKIGFISKDDIVKNNQGKTIYFIDKNGNVIDAGGKNLGKAQKSGHYYTKD